MALSEMNTTQWDDLIALSLALVRGPGWPCMRGVSSQPEWE